MKPIIFSTPMVQAILEGRKMQTRRVVKPQPGFYVGQVIKPGDEQFFHPNEKDGWRPSKVWKLMEPSGTNGGCLTVNYKCPYGAIGDILYVRESWAKLTYGEQSFIGYRADNGHHPDRKWKPSIHMPKEAARLFLKITEIKVERLQDISQEDARDEGVGYAPHRPSSSGCKLWVDHSLRRDCCICDFRMTWMRINGESGMTWDFNPWVWVITFERIEKPY